MAAFEEYHLITECQKEWAKKKGILYSSLGSSETQADELSMNLFNGLHPKTREEFESGAGREIEKHMYVLWSSSALVVNVFDYWRNNNRISEIAVACGAPDSMDNMTFEKRYKIGKHGIAHLDVEFTGCNGKFAIEAKFTEPYRNAFTLGKYLAVKEYWQNLPNSRILTEDIVSDEQKKPGFKYLDACQLIKHILGLSYPPNNTRNFTLLYLWYNNRSVMARELEKEIQHFGDCVGNDIVFKSLTYQDLFNNIKAIPDVDSKYIDYLGERYF